MDVSDLLSIFDTSLAVGVMVLFGWRLTAQMQAMINANERVIGELLELVKTLKEWE